MSPGLSASEIFVIALFATSVVFGVVGTIAMGRALESRGAQVPFLLSNNPVYLWRVYRRLGKESKTPMLDFLSVSIVVAFVAAILSTILLVPILSKFAGPGGR